MVECLFANLMVVGSSPVAVTETSDLAPVSSKEFADISVYSLWNAYITWQEHSVKIFVLKKYFALCQGLV